MAQTCTPLLGFCYHLSRARRWQHRLPGGEEIRTALQSDKCLIPGQGILSDAHRFVARRWAFPTLRTACGAGMSCTRHRPGGMGASESNLSPSGGTHSSSCGLQAFARTLRVLTSVRWATKGSVTRSAAATGTHAPRPLRNWGRSPSHSCCGTTWALVQCDAAPEHRAGTNSFLGGLERAFAADISGHWREHTPPGTWWLGVADRIGRRACLGSVLPGRLASDPEIRENEHDGLAREDWNPLSGISVC